MNFQEKLLKFIFTTNHVFCTNEVNIVFLMQLSVAAICLFVILPLNLVGTVLGRNMAGTPDYPCRINTVPRPIPEKKW